MIALDGRHPGTVEIVRWFDYDHLQEPARVSIAKEKRFCSTQPRHSTW